MSNVYISGLFSFITFQLAKDVFLIGWRPHFKDNLISFNLFVKKITKPYLDIFLDTVSVYV